MFRQLIDAFKKKDVISDMIAQLGEMLEIGRWMFVQACDVVDKKVEPASIHDDLYARDKRINELEQSIRERIVVHLVTGHEQDVGICLVLMSVSKDAERIGDYCKNLYQIGEFFQSEYRRAEFTTPLTDIRRTIEDLFPRIRQAFAEADKRAASDAVDQTRMMRKNCDLLIRQLLTPGGTSAPDEAAAYALRARFYKRVVAHLGNIATAVNNPVPMLDYRKKRPLDEPGE